MLIRRAALPLLVAIGVAIACVGVGALARRAEEADLPLDLLIGYPLFGTACFAVGLLKVSAWTMVPLVVLGALAGVLKILAGWSSPRPAVGAGEGRRAIAGAFAAAVVIACGFVWAQAPPSSLDELAYHLAVPLDGSVEGQQPLQGAHAPFGAPFLVTADGHVEAKDDGNKSRIGHVAEGVTTARSADDLARQLGVELPICTQVCQVLYAGKLPRDAVDDLLRRPLKRE